MTMANRRKYVERKRVKRDSLATAAPPPKPSSTPRGIAVRVIADTYDHDIRPTDVDRTITIMPEPARSASPAAPATLAKPTSASPVGVAVSEHGGAIYVCDADHRRVVALRLAP